MLGLLWYLILLQLAVSGVGLLVVDPDSKGDTLAADGAGSTTSTTAKPKGATASGADTKAKSKEAPTTAAPTTASTAAPAKATTTSTTRPAGQVLKPAAAGKYDYRTTYTDADGETDTSTGQYTMSAARQSEGEVRQTEVDVEDGTTTTNNYAWRADGLYLRSADEDGSECDFEPDIKLVASPPTVGRQWSIGTSCTIEGETLKLQGTSRIARTERITVAGTQVNVHVIETTVSGGGMEFRGVTSFSVERGLTVRDETIDDDGSSEVTELLNLDPK